MSRWLMGWVGAVDLVALITWVKIYQRLNPGITRLTTGWTLTIMWAALAIFFASYLRLWLGSE